MEELFGEATNLKGRSRAAGIATRKTSSNEEIVGNWTKYKSG